MKKIFLFAVSLLIPLLSFCEDAKETKVLKVGATPDPHAAMLEVIKDDLAKKGIELKIVEFTDYVVPNEAVEAGEIDANFFQHAPYMESFNADRKSHLVSAGGIHIEPLALYSKKYKDSNKIKAKAKIAIPADPTNEGRALLLLQSAGFIALNPKSGLTATPADITANPKKLKFVEVEAASLPRVLQDVDAAVINGNYALQAGLTASKDGLFVEGKDSPYVNVVAVKDGRQNDSEIKALMEALTSQKMKDYLAQKYPSGDVVPVF